MRLASYSLLPAFSLFIHGSHLAWAFLASKTLPPHIQRNSSSYRSLSRISHTSCNPNSRQRTLHAIVPEKKRPRRRITITSEFSIILSKSQTGIMPLSYSILSEQNANTTNAIIEHYSTNQDFNYLSKVEGSLILQRDEEDAFKLQKGIDFAKVKGIIDPNFIPEEYITIDVLGKTPDEVADEILEEVGRITGEGGGIIVLCGLSGTGKGTTVAKLKEKLEIEHGKQVVSWSNGNVFRSVTLLAATWCEQQENSSGFDPQKALTKENLASFIRMLEFGKFNGKYDIKIQGLGLDLLVSEVQNTELKAPKVAKNIPTVAEVTQGEVILFAANSIKKMGEDGIFVLLEGREQTVNYVRTPLRFTLTMSDMTLIGKRRAAQRLAAETLAEVKEGASEEDIAKAMDKKLAIMVKEHV